MKALHTCMIAASTLATCAGGAMAQLHAGDILLYVQNNRIVTGQVNVSTGLPEPGVRAFQADFGESPNFTNDPGMDSEDGVFPGGSGVGFTIRKASASGMESTLIWSPTSGFRSNSEASVPLSRR